MKYTITETENGRELVIHEGATEIPFEQFEHLSLSKVVIPEGVTTINAWAFHNNCLEEAVIPHSVVDIRRESFTSNNLKKVYITNTDCKIHPSAFDKNVKIIRSDYNKSQNIHAMLDNAIAQLEQIKQLLKKD
jgi:hypothetical protein